MIKHFENLTIEEVEFLVNFYDGFDYNFTKGYCSVEIDEHEYNFILKQLDKKEAS